MFTLLSLVTAVSLPRYFNEACAETSAKGSPCERYSGALGPDLMGGHGLEGAVGAADGAGVAGDEEGDTAGGSVSTEGSASEISALLPDHSSSSSSSSSTYSSSYESDELLRGDLARLLQMCLVEHMGISQHELESFNVVGT